MRVKRRDEHTVTDDRCISLFSFPSPRRPAVRRGNEVRPPACHLGSWEKGWGVGGWGGGGVVVWRSDGSDEGGGHTAFIPLRASCMTTRAATLCLPRLLIFFVYVCLCVFVWVHARVPTERDKWLPRSLATFSLRRKEYHHLVKRRGFFPWWRAVFLKLGKLVRRGVDACTAALLQCVTRVIDIFLLSINVWFFIRLVNCNC